MLATQALRTRRKELAPRGNAETLGERISGRSAKLRAAAASQSRVTVGLLLLPHSSPERKPSPCNSRGPCAAAVPPWPASEWRREARRPSRRLLSCREQSGGPPNISNDPPSRLEPARHAAPPLRPGSRRQSRWQAGEGKRKSEEANLPSHRRSRATTSDMMRMSWPPNPCTSPVPSMCNCHRCRRRRRCRGCVGLSWCSGAVLRS